MELLIAYGLLAIGTSFVCSMLEASLLSVPEGYVQALARRGSRAGRMLRRMKQNVDRPLTAILTVNTVANTVGAAGVGAQAALVFGSVATGIATGIMTLSILIVSEIIPKTVGAVHCRGLAGFTAYTTRTMVLICLPLVLVIEWVKERAGYGEQITEISRLELQGTLRMGRETGSLEEHEHEVICNILSLPEISVSHVFTPRTVMFSLPEKMTVSRALEKHSPIRFSRIPVYRELPARIEGYVPRFELHRAAIEGRADTTLADLKEPVMFVPEVVNVGDALTNMLAAGEHMAIAVDEHGAVEGIVTLEDLLETLLGREIVDETDRVEDLRELAKEQGTATKA
jgi:CBS domain containing-hemolysin-like protein